MARLSKARENEYQRLRKAIGSTPLLPVPLAELQRDSALFAKAEYRNPSGSHYDREMIEFLYNLEATGVISPADTEPMLETTTGNSGSSFAWLCRALGFTAPAIIIPEDMPPARISQIESFGAQVIRSPAGRYISGISKEFASRMNDWPGHIPQHWQDVHSCVKAMGACGQEIVDQIEDLAEGKLDLFFLALGNGSSAAGIIPVLRERFRRIKIIGVEPEESPIVAEFINQTDRDAAERMGLLEYATPRTGDRAHGIFGTGPAEIKQIYPNMRAAAKQLDGIAHVNTADALKMQTILMDRLGLHVGRSSAMCTVAAVRHPLEFSGAHIGTIFYDPAWKYL